MIAAWKGFEGVSTKDGDEICGMVQGRMTKSKGMIWKREGLCVTR